MKRETGSNLIEKLNISKKILFAGLVLCVLLALGTTGVVMAKYYAKRDNKGVSTSSGLYFNSNCISNIAGSVDTDIRTIDLSTVPGYVNPEGGNIFWLDIRNYDNHLLYNELYLDMEYTICFLKVQGLSASVTYKDDTGTDVVQPLEDNQVFTLNNRKLKGGSAKFHSYKIITENVDATTYAKVLVMAFPTSPDYVSAAQEDMRLVGILQAQPQMVEIGIASTKWLMQERQEAEYNADWKKVVRQNSGLVYSIQTNGDDVTSGSVKGELKITWNHDMLSINQYDTYYLEALETLANADSSDDAIIKDDASGTTTMKIRVLPYSNVKITFYKTDNFNQAFGNDTMTKADFEGYVSATLASGE